MFGVVSVFFFMITLSSTGGEVFHPLVFAPEGINQRAPLSPSWCRIFFCACANLMSLKPRYWSFKKKLIEIATFSTELRWLTGNRK